MKIEFTNPLALLLLLLIPAAIYLARHSLANLSRRRAAWSTGIRILILLLLVLALAGLRLRATAHDLALLFLVDVSASVAPDQQKDILAFINAEMQRAAPRDYVGVIAFGRDAVVEVAPTRKEILGDWQLKEISSAPSRDYTDIAGALKLASALVPEDAVGRLVLISDGNENLENAIAEARLLKAEAIEVHTRALNTVNDGSHQQGEIAVRELLAPQQLAEGEAFELKATIDSTVDTDAKLRIFRNDTLIAERPVQLAANGENVFILPERNDRKGFYTYRAEIEALQADSFVQNNSREAFTLVEGKPKLLYVTGDSQPSAALLRVFAEGNFVVDTSHVAPTSLAGFQDYDLVVFDNLPATQLTREQMKMAQAYARDLGGGFLMIGGEQSFGPGGYYKTPIAEMLPVSLDIRQKKHFPALALVLVIDKSGSMAEIQSGGRSKMELAQEAASTAVDFLSERDSVGVLAFDSEAQTVAEITKVEDKKKIIKEILSIQAVGGTAMYPGIRQAYQWLQASDAQIKHIIVLSDGQSEPGDFAGIAKAVSAAGMTLSTIAVGRDADVRGMKMIADLGGGRFYATDRAETLPQIFTREAFLASRSTIIEEPFQPRLVRATQATNGIDWTGAPQLNGYVGTAERDAANSPAITALLSDKDDPVYAVWQYGLGRVAAFTSDAKARWAVNWMNWSGFGQFWTQVLRDTLRREGSNELQPRVEINAGKGHVVVEALRADGSFKNNLRLQAHIVAPDFSTSEVTLEQSASGRYEGDFEAVTRGAYLVSVNEAGGLTAPITGSVNSYSPEFSITSADANLLAQISEVTGGSVLNGNAANDNSSNSTPPNSSSDAANPSASTGKAKLFDHRTEKTTPREIFATLLLLAVLLLPVDVGLRRVHLSREQSEAARDWLTATLRRAPKQETLAATAAAHAQLKRSRRRVRLSAEDATDEVVSKPLAPALQKSHQPAAFIATDQLDNARTNEAKRRANETATSSAAPAAKPVAGQAEGEAKIVTETARTTDDKSLASRLLDAKRKKRD
ncbi:MAG: VWA domain-containing protein [Acidobacteria bacterium]|nr:VWA domain-containing protein [Acidobacteriota bacterium]